MAGTTQPGGNVAGRIEDYAIVGDMQSAALVSTDGSVNWLCLPHPTSRAMPRNIGADRGMSDGACRAKKIRT
jgi:trehalase-like protein